MGTIATLASLAALGYSAYYFVACSYFAFGRCLRCNGTGKRRSRTGRSTRECRRCYGTGRRVRIGRRLYDYLRAECERGTR